jgi:hypothetical protein
MAPAVAKKLALTVSFQQRGKRFQEKEEVNGISRGT